MFGAPSSYKHNMFFFLFFISAAAVIFFFTYEANMVLQTWYSVTEPSTTWSTIILRKLLTIIVGVGLIIFVFLSILLQHVYQCSLFFTVVYNNISVSSLFSLWLCIQLVITFSHLAVVKNDECFFFHFCKKNK